MLSEGFSAFPSLQREPGHSEGCPAWLWVPQIPICHQAGSLWPLLQALDPPLMGYRHPLTGLGWFGLLGLGVRFEEGSVPGFVGHCVHPLPPKGCGWGVDGRGWGLCSPLLFWSAAVPGGLWGHRRDWQHQELLSQRLCRSLRGAGKGWRWWLPCDSSAAIWGQTPGLMGPPPPLQTLSQPSGDLGDPTLSPPQTPTVTACPHCHISSCIHHGIS